MNFSGTKIKGLKKSRWLVKIALVSTTGVPMLNIAIDTTKLKEQT